MSTSIVGAADTNPLDHVSTLPSNIDSTAASQDAREGANLSSDVGKDEKDGITAGKGLKSVAVEERVVQAIKQTNDADVHAVLVEILSALKRSTIVPREAADKKTRFWTVHKSQSEEYDQELYAKYSGSMDNSTIFAGLFLSVGATFASLMLPNLLPDPNQQTEALLRVIAFSLNASAVALLPDPSPVQADPSSTTVWVQCLLYASIVCSLFAALGAVLGKQWLDHYMSVGERGTIEARGMERQRKFAALESWHFRTILEFFPILLQASLFLFAVALSAYMWDVQRTVALVLIVTNSVGFLFYFISIIASLLFPDCPFQSSVSGILRRLTDLFRAPFAVIVDIFKYLYIGVMIVVIAIVIILYLFAMLFLSCSHAYQQLSHSDAENARPPPDTDAKSDTWLQILESLGYHAGRVWGSINTHFIGVVPSTLGFIAKLRRSFKPVTPKDHLTGMAVVWLSETSTDPLVLADAMQVVPEIRWSPDLHVPMNVLEFLFRRVLDNSRTVVRNESTPDTDDRAVLLCSSFLLFYWERILADYKEVDSWIQPQGDTLRDAVKPSLSALRAELENNPDTLPFSKLVHLLALGSVDMWYYYDLPFKQPLVHEVDMPTDPELLCARTVLFQSQYDIKDKPTFYFRIIQRCSTLAKDETQRILYIIALAAICGFEDNEAREHAEANNDQRDLTAVGSDAAQHLLTEIIVFLSSAEGRTNSGRQSTISSNLRISSTDDKEWLQFLSVFTRLIQGNSSILLQAKQSFFLLNLCRLLPSFDNASVSASSQRLAITAGLLHASLCCLVEPSKGSIPSPPYTSGLLQEKDSWTPSPSHYDWLIAFVEKLHEHQRVGDSILDADMVLHTTADAFLAISRMSDAISKASDSRLLRALDWALHATHPDLKYWESPAHPFFRLQSAALSLIDSLSNKTDPVLPGVLTDAPDFLEKLSMLVSQPPFSDSASPGRLEHIANRDSVFGSIVLKLAGDDMDSWINDERNFVVVRHWMYAMERYDIRPDSMAPRKLLRCRAFREPSVEKWNGDMNCVHYVSTPALDEEWRKRDWTITDPGSREQIDLVDLIACTLRFLEKDIPPEWGGQWYAERLIAIGSVLETHARDDGIADELRPLRHALVERLDFMFRSYSSVLKDVHFNRAALLAD